jgi:hypothetical protein
MKLIVSLLLAAVVNAGTYTDTIHLGNAGLYAILAKTGISSVPDSTVVGDIAVSPAAATYITGFGLDLDEAAVFSLASQVQGKAFAADYAVPTPDLLTQSVVHMLAAYTNASLRTTTDPNRINLNGGSLGDDMQLTPGVYTFTTGVNINSNIYLVGEADDVFIFQTTGVLTLATSTKVFLTGGVQAKNVFWQVAGNVSIGGSSVMQGVILCKTNVVMITGSALIGRILSQTEVALQKAQVTEASVDIEAFYDEGIYLEGACGYAVLAESGIATVPDSTVVGNIGVSPITAAAMTGFALDLDSSGQFATSSQVSGEAHGASYGGDIAKDLTVAVIAMHAAYTAASLRPNLDEARKNVNGGDIGGLTLTPGVYTFTVTLQITKDVILEGGVNDVFVFQNTAVLTQSVDTKVILKGGVQAKNVIWQNAMNVKIQPRAHFEGIIMCKTDVAIETGASVNGAIFAQTAVALQMATVTSDGVGMCAGEPERDVTQPEPVAEVPAVVKTVEIGTAGNYAVLAKDSITTKATSTVTGNIAVSVDSDSVIGFGLTLDSLGQFSTASQVTGKVFAKDYTGPVPAELTYAFFQMNEAYLDAEGRPPYDDAMINTNGGAIGGLILTPGVYTFTIITKGITIDADVTFQGGPDDIFIIRTNGPLTMAPATEVILTGGVQAKNIFWQVAGDVTVGRDAEMQGVLLAGSDVLFEGGSTLEGRIMSQKGVTLQMAVIGTEEAFCG